MARTRQLRIDDIKKAVRPRGSFWFIQGQQRAYIRINGQFVSIGYYVEFARYRKDKPSGLEVLKKVIFDNQLE